MINLGKEGKRKQHRRRYSDLLASITASALAVMNVPFGVIAGAEDENADQPVVESLGIISTETSAAAPRFMLFSLNTGTVDLKSGNHQNWIGRIDVPDYITSFYNDLVEWTDNDGTKDYLIGDTSAYETVSTSDGTSYNCVKLFNVTLTSSTQASYVRNAIQAAYDAFDRDHPEVFWLDGSTNVLTSYSGNNYTFYWVISGGDFSVFSSAYPNSSAIKTAISERNSKVNTIIGGASGTDYQKVKYFNEWLTNHNEYNTSPDLTAAQSSYPDAWECISALTGKTGTNGPVCEGYARAMKVLCDQSGIPCVLADGDAGEAHMWNNIKIGGSWYVTDTTWNDPKGGASGAVSGAENEDYLLIGSANSKLSSRTTQNRASTGGVSFTNGPVLSSADYVPIVEKTVTGISVKTEPTDKSYFCGESFDPSGLVITVDYSDSTSADIAYSTANAADFSFSPDTFTTAGDNLTVTVTYKEKNANITGIKAEKNSLTVSDFTFTPPSDLTYDGNRKDAAVTAKKTGAGTVTVKYYKDGIKADPIATGTYTVKINVSEGTAYKEVSDMTDPSWTFTIGGASLKNASVTVDSSTDYYYNKGTEIKPAVTVKLGSAVLTKDTDYTVSYENNKNAGTAKVIVTGINDYSGTASATFTIKKATPIVTDVAAVGTVYTSTAPSNVLLTGITDTTGSFKLSGVSAFTAGINDYSYIFTPDDNSNYTTASGNVSINAVSDDVQSISIISAPKKTDYSAGESFDPTGLSIKVKYLSGAEKNVSYTAANASSFTFTPALGTALTSSNTSVNAVYTENGKSASCSITINVGKAIPTVTVPTGITATYGQTLNELTLPSDANGAWAWLDNSLKSGNVGTNKFIAEYTPNNTADYSTVKKEVTVTVTPAPLTVDSASAVSRPYDKTNKAEASVNFSGIVNSETLEKNVDYTVSAEFDTPNAGTGKTVTVTVTMLNSEKAKNYALTNNTVKTAADIIKIDPSAVIPSALVCSYKDGETPSLANVALPAGWTWDNSSQTLIDGNNSCDVSFIPADAENYNTLHKTVTVNVVKTECEHIHTTETYSPVGAKCGDSVIKTITCTDCNTVLSSVTMIKEHEWDSAYTVDTPATCTTPGVKSIHCRLCNEKKDVTAIPASGHTGGTATCTEAAVCSVCLMPYGDPLGHSWDEAYSYDSAEHWHECTRCHEKNDVENHISDGGIVTTPATASTTGLKTYSCTVCGMIISTEVIPATGGGTVIDPPQPVQPSYPVPSYSGTSQTGNQPQIKDDNGKTGWAAIADAIASTDKGSVTIDLNGASSVPKNIIEEAAKRQIDLIIEVNKDIKWTVYGESITSPKMFKPGVTKGTKKIPADVISEVSGGNTVIQLSLAHNGEFGFDAVMSINLGSKYNGMYANLYYYNKNANTLELADCAEIANGNAQLMFTHASDWAIVISEQPTMVYEDINSSAGIMEASENSAPSAAMPLAVLAISAAAVITAVVLRKKAEK